MPIAVVRDAFADHQFHSEERTALAALAGIEDFRDAWMIHQGQGLSFGLEPGDHIRRVHAEFDDLERDFASEGFELLGAIDDPTPAFSELFEDAVAIESVDEGMGCGGVIVLRCIRVIRRSVLQSKRQEATQAQPDRQTGFEPGAALRAGRRGRGHLIYTKELKDWPGRVTD